MNKTKKYIEVSVLDELVKREDETQMVGGYYPVHSEKHIVELPDLSHYRRRSPSEKPEQSRLVIFSYDDMLYIGDYFGGDKFRYHGLFINISDVTWWAYCYIPEQ